MRSNRAHAFVRVTVIVDDGAETRASRLHVVDLMGSRSFRGGDADAGAAAAWERDRKLAAAQLLAFSRVVDELSKRRSVVGVDESPVLSARDSALTTRLTPLLAGGAKTFFLACVSPLEEDYLDTLNTLRVAQRAEKIEVACFRSTTTTDDEKRDGADATAAFVSLRDVVAGGGESRRASPSPSPSPSPPPPRSPPRARDANAHTASAPNGLLSPIRPAKLPEGLAPDPSGEVRRRRLDRPSPPPLEFAAPRTTTTKTTTTTTEGNDDDDDDDGTPDFGFAKPATSNALGNRLEALKAEFSNVYDDVTGGGGGGGGAEDEDDYDAYFQPDDGGDGPVYVPPGKEGTTPKSLTNRAPGRFPLDAASAAAAAAAARRGLVPDGDEDLRKEVEESRRRYDALLGMLRAEETTRADVESRAHAAVADANERVVAAEAAAADAKAAATTAKARLRAVESASDFADVFERYDADATALRRECARLREECVDAHVAAALTSSAIAEMLSNGGGGGEGGDVGEGLEEYFRDGGESDDDDGGDGDAEARRGARVVAANADVQRRVGFLKKSLRRAESERRKLEEEFLEIRKRERAFHVHKRGREDQIARLRRAETREAHAEREASKLRAEIDAAARRVAEAERVAAERVASCARKDDENDALREDLKKRNARIRQLEQREQEVKLLRNSGRFDSALRSDHHLRGSAGGSGGGPADDALRATDELRRSLPAGSSSRMDGLFDRLTREIEASLTTRSSEMPRPVRGWDSSTGRKATGTYDPPGAGKTGGVGGGGGVGGVGVRGSGRRSSPLRERGSFANDDNARRSPERGGVERGGPVGASGGGGGGGATPPRRRPARAVPKQLRLIRPSTAGAAPPAPALKSKPRYRSPPPPSRASREGLGSWAEAAAAGRRGPAPAPPSPSPSPSPPRGRGGGAAAAARATSRSPPVSPARSSRAGAGWY